MEFLVIALFVILLFFGGKKLPGLMRGIGQGMSEFKKETRKKNNIEKED